MSDVSKFKILDKIVNVKDNDGRLLISSNFNTLDSKIDETNSNLNNRIDTTNTKIDKITNKFSNFINVVTDFGADNTGNSDSTNALKNAFATENSFIYFPAGKYLTSDIIRINSNTYLYGHGALIQNEKSNCLFVNNSDGNAGGYSANSNITIEGMQFVGLNMVQTIVAFGHCSDIRIINCNFASNSLTHEYQYWNLLKIISCTRVLIENSNFTGTATFANEMLQLDVMSEEVFPWFGPYDNTSCAQVEISNCYFSHPEKYKYDILSIHDTGIGNHNGSNSTPIEYINIHGCYFNNVTTAFKFQYLRFSNIINNIAYNSMNGFAYLSDHIINNVKISDNTFYGNASDYHDKIENTFFGRGISIGMLNGQDCSDNVISGNNIIGFASHGIAVNGRFCEICNNIIRSNGYTGLYVDYDQYKCNIHDNISENNAVLDQENYDILVSHTHNTKALESGGNDIYNNKANSVKCEVYSTDNLKSRFHDNVYSEITYPSDFNSLNVYGNTKFNGNPNYYTDSNMTASPTTNTWYTPVAFNADHTCYALINFNTTIPANFVGAFNIRIIDSSDQRTIALNTIENSYQSIAHSGGNLSIFAKILAGHTISGEIFFVHINGTIESIVSTITAIELPISLENTD